MSDAHYTERDDGFHFDEMSDRWWETETCWFSFHNVERRLGGWLYVMVRPNIGTVAGGCWVWDDSASNFWEVPYSANYSALRLRDNTDLRDAALPTGVSVKTIEPLTRYKLRYDDPPRLQIDLDWTAVMPPQPITSTGTGFGHLSHFDQFGRVEGSIVLHGEAIPINCVSIRDRSWGPRPEHRPLRTAYVTAATTDGRSGFLAVAAPAEEGGPARHGFWLRDGKAVILKSASRFEERAPDTGFLSKVTVEGKDVDGAEFCAEGRPLSRIVINRHTFIDINSLIEWTFTDGQTAYGEDQDCWPVHDFSAYRRLARLGGRQMDG